MRETKDQTINRLKQKVSELESEIKKQKMIVREKSKELKSGLTETESLKETEFKEKTRQYKDRITELNKKYNKLRDKFYAIMLRTSRSKKNALFSLNLMADLEKEWYEQIESDNRERLEAYKRGDILDPYGNLYFFDNNLMLTINPHTGERLSMSQIIGIYKRLCDNGNYLMAISEVANYKKNDRGFNYLTLVDRKGREIYEKYYSDFDFSIHI